MELNIERLANGVILHPEGSLDDTNAAQFTPEARAQIQPEKGVILDLSKVPSASVSGLRALIGLQRWISMNQGRLVLSNIGQDLGQSLKENGCEGMFEIVGSVEDARALLQWSDEEIPSSLLPPPSEPSISEPAFQEREVTPPVSTPPLVTPSEPTYSKPEPALPSTSWEPSPISAPNPVPQVKESFERPRSPEPVSEPSYAAPASSSPPSPQGGRVESAWDRPATPPATSTPTVPTSSFSTPSSALSGRTVENDIWSNPTPQPSKSASKKSSPLLPMLGTLLLLGGGGFALWHFVFKGENKTEEAQTQNTQQTELPAPELRIDSPVEIKVGEAFSKKFTGRNAVRIELEGPLPEGLTYESASATLSGTPTASGTHELVINAFNGSQKTTALLTLKVLAVEAPPVPPTPPAPPVEEPEMSKEDPSPQPLDPGMETEEQEVLVDETPPETISSQSPEVAALLKDIDARIELSKESRQVKDFVREMLPKITEIQKTATVYFGTAGDKLNAANEAILKKAVETDAFQRIAEHPRGAIFVLGFSDPVGNAESNYILSQKRAHAVEKILKETYGVTVDVHVLPMGQTELLGNTPAQRSNNRAAEIWAVVMPKP